MNVVEYKQSESLANYSIDQHYTYAGNDFWDWSVWIKAADKDIDKIDHVIYTLHYTFPNPVRKIDERKDNFKLNASGWGTFTIYARLNFKDESILELEHELELYYPDGEQCEE